MLIVTPPIGVYPSSIAFPTAILRGFVPFLLITIYSDFPSSFFAPVLFATYNAVASYLFTCFLSVSQMVDSEYGNLDGLESSNDRLNRKIERLQNSLSYRLGKIITDSLRKPWRLAIMPILLSILAKNYVFERLGLKSPTGAEFPLETSKTRDCIVLFPTNGVGLGHFSRMISLARSIRRKRPTMEVVFFTTNFVLHPLYSMGFTCYHLPGRKKFRSMEPSTWNLMCEETLSNIINLHRPSIFVFDGAYPYRGMLNGIKNRDSIHKVWVRRLGIDSTDSSPRDAVSHFDRIVIPGDFLNHNEDMISKWDVEEVNIAPPLISVSRADLLPRGELRNRLGIPADSQLCLVSLGAGVINNISDTRRFVVEGLTERGIYVIIAESMLNPLNESFENPLVRVVKEFPIMNFRNCLDFAVIAAGYNSIHEAALLKLPSLVLPNENTSSDDQLGRANNASEKGCFIVINEEDYDMLDLAIDRISDVSVRTQMIEGMSSGENILDGAPFLADALIEKTG